MRPRSLVLNVLLLSLTIMLSYATGVGLRLMWARLPADREIASMIPIFVSLCSLGVFLSLTILIGRVFIGAREQWPAFWISVPVVFGLV